MAVRQFLPRKASNNRPPIEAILGSTPDTSEYMDFDFFQWVKYRDRTGARVDNIKLGKWLGVATKIGSPLTYWILKDNGHIIARSTVRPLLPEELNNADDEAKRQAFRDMLRKRYGNSIDSDDTPLTSAMPPLPEQGDSEEEEETKQGDYYDKDTSTITPVADGNSTDDTQEAKERSHTQQLVKGSDPFDGAEIILPHGDKDEIAKVLGRKRDSEGNFIGRAHSNPILDSRVFTTRFPDGDEQDILYNTIATHLFSQVDSEGNQYRLFQEIIGHKRKDTAVDKGDQYKTDGNGRCIKRKTVTGWELEVEWRDGTTTWIPLKEMKESNPQEIIKLLMNRLLNGGLHMC